MGLAVPALVDRSRDLLSGTRAKVAGASPSVDPTSRMSALIVATRSKRVPSAFSKVAASDSGAHLSVTPSSWGRNPNLT